MAPQPSGGTSSATAAAKPPQPSTNGTYNFNARSGDELRCRCCPYGFHIDLDFVKFAENVTAGNDQARKWNTQPRRTTRRRGNYSVDESATALPRPIITRDTNSFDAPDEWLTAGNASLNMSQSTTGGFCSGVDDDLLPTHDIPSFNNYLAKNKSDSIVARLIGELNGIDNSRKPPIPPPISSSTPYPGQDFIDHKPQKSWHGATSANSEIHEILSRQQPTYSTTREFSKTVTSAPSSPTPVKTYHSAVAQSAARKAQSSSSSATTSKHHQQSPITPPRRYFDSARPRVLSPEPAARDRNLAPTALRTSNFHSRTYYSPPTSATTTTENHARVPYRGATSSLSTKLDFNSFASVRRQRTNTDERNRTLSPIYNRQTGGSRLDGYTSDAEYRTTYRYEMSPPPLPPRSHPPLPTTPTTPVKMYSYGNSTTAAKKQPENVFENLKKPETVERGVDAFEVQNVQEVSKKAILQHQESQTRTPPEQKHASTVTDTEQDDDEEEGTAAALKSTELSTQITQTQSIDQSTIGCNTDKIPEEPFQPEKAFSVEFQFALGHEPEHHPDEIAAMLSNSKKETKEQGSDAIKTAMFSIGMNTDRISMVDKACASMPPPVKPKTAEKGVVTDIVQSEEVDEKKKEAATIETQTEEIDEKVENKMVVEAKPKESTTIETQTDIDWIEAEVERRIKAEKAERKSVDKITETEEEDSEFIMITCTKCEQSSISNGHEHYEKIVEHEAEEGEAGEEEADPNHTQTDSIGDHESGFSNSSTDLEEFEKLEQSIQDQEKHQHNQQHHDPDVPPEPMFRHSLSSEPEFSDHDRESLDTVSIKTMIMVDSNVEEKKQQQPVDSSKIEAIRKLLTEPSRSPFSRESGAYRSYRNEKAKTTDDLDFITDKHNQNDDTGEPSTPSSNSQSALTDMVMLKKAIQITSLVPEPVAAKIPRPKVSKYNLTAEEASTPDEEEEAADRLTPLRSELRSLALWSGPFRPAQDLGYRRFAAAQNAAASKTTPMEEDEVEGEIQNSGASSDSEGTYEMSDKEDPDEIIEFEMSEPLKEALETLNDHLKKPDDVATQAVDWAQRYVQHTWLKMATKRKSTAGWVEKFLDALESYEPALMELIVNFADNNGNTALHYAVSHENYDLVSVLLDSKVCNVDNNNIAGYSPVMLGSLCEIRNETHSTIIQRLFEIGNVNAKAIKHGQTALQLAASHGRVETTQLLLNCGADVNIQDIDGSTALMCAAEHGHKEIAKMLLKCSNIDASLTDCDNQTALSIAVQQGHKALAVLIYAHLNFHRYQSSENSSAV